MVLYIRFCNLLQACLIFVVCALSGLLSGISSNEVGCRSQVDTLLTALSHVCLFTAFSENLQCTVNSHENTDNALNEMVCPNFWPVQYI